MSALRWMLQDGGLERVARSGDNTMTCMVCKTIATDANAILDVATVAGGFVQFTGFTAGRTLTTDTAANILAANPWMDIGDTFAINVSITTAFAGTLVAGTGVTLAGRATVPASSVIPLLFTKTGTATVTLNVF